MLENSPRVSTHSRAEAAAYSNPLPFVMRAIVSTHSRTKAAAHSFHLQYRSRRQFQHTAARRRLQQEAAELKDLSFVSTHSRTKAAALSTMKGTDVLRPVSTHSRTKAAASASGPSSWSAFGFQHTAARRRLPPALYRKTSPMCFNTQPHEGGCSLYKKVRKISELNTVFR